MKSCPRAVRRSTGLLDILDLFPHAFELRFCIDDELGDVNPVRLRSDRVDFAIHFLDQKIEFAAARLIAISQGAPVRQVRAKAGDGDACPDLTPLGKATRFSPEGARP